MISIRALVGLSFLSILCSCSEEPVAVASVLYDAAQKPHCAASSRDGLAGVHDNESPEGGIRFSVRTPANYDARFGHPLLVVYPAAGHSRFETERFTGFTFDATAAGFIVAYPDHRRLSLKTLDAIATIPQSIAKKWCIDRQRIFLTGHSDGGTAASAIAFREDDGFSPTAIAPSAAGISSDDLKEIECPAPRPVMVLHNDDDKLFPGYGSEAAKWWATCNKCDVSARTQSKNGCIEYSSCANNARVKYCAQSGGHRQWPAKNTAILNFFLNVGRNRAG